MLSNLLDLNSKGLHQSSGKQKESFRLLLPSSTKREIRQFHVAVLQRRQRNLQKKVMHAQSCCFANLNQLLFCCSRCRRRRRCVNSLITWVRWCLRRKLPLVLRNINWFYFSHNLKQKDVKWKVLLIINFQTASYIYQHNLDHCQPLSTNKLKLFHTAIISDRSAIHFGIPRRTCIHEV